MNVNKKRPKLKWLSYNIQFSHCILCLSSILSNLFYVTDKMHTSQSIRIVKLAVILAAAVLRKAYIVIRIASLNTSVPDAVEGTDFQTKRK